MLEFTNLTNKKVSRARVLKIAGLFFKKYKLQDDFSVSVVICSDEYIKKLNHQYRGKNEVTDILAFPGLNEIFINVSQVVRQAREEGRNALYEFDFILVHGLLHLIGFKDEQEKDRLKMIEEGERFLREIKWSASLAFTLIEVMVVVFIITIISSLVLINYNVGYNDANLINSQVIVYENLKTAQNYALSNKSYQDLAPVYWGVNFSVQEQEITLFADLNGNGKVDEGEDDVFSDARKINLGEGIIFKNSFLINSLSILFSLDTGRMNVYVEDDDLLENFPWIIELRDEEYNMASLIYLEPPALIDVQKCSCSDENLYCCSFCDSGSTCLDFENP